jgi:hypothetical protein
VTSALKVAKLRGEKPLSVSEIRKLEDDSLRNEVSHVVLVGGLTRLRLVSEKISNLFPDSMVHTVSNPQEMVALGLTYGKKLESLNLPRPPVNINIVVGDQKETVYCAFTPLYHPNDLYNFNTLAKHIELPSIVNLGDSFLQCESPTRDKRALRMSIMVLHDQGATPYLWWDKDDDWELVDQNDISGSIDFLAQYDDRREVREYDEPNFNDLSDFWRGRFEQESFERSIYVGTKFHLPRATNQGFLNINVDGRLIVSTAGAGQPGFEAKMKILFWPLKRISKKQSSELVERVIGSQISIHKSPKVEENEFIHQTNKPENKQIIEQILESDFGADRLAVFDSEQELDSGHLTPTDALSIKRVTTINEVEAVLERTVAIANNFIASGALVYLDSATNEEALFCIIEMACIDEGFSSESVELISGHKFPDVVFRDAQIGVEIKGHRQGGRILGNSIMGSTPSLDNPIAIYLLAWNDAEKLVVWRDYFSCVVGAEVTHSPRFVLNPNCKVDESLFGDDDGQIGNASEICLGADGFKSEVILSKMRAKALAEGNIPWWISGDADDLKQSSDDAQRQLAIVKYSRLDASKERPALLKTLLIGFPEILGRSQIKYDDALVWSLLRKSVLITRDAFTAGGQQNVLISAICGQSPLTVPQVFIRAKSILESPANVMGSDISEIWQSSIVGNEEFLSELRNKYQSSGISAYASLVLHKQCSCSSTAAEDFAKSISEWILEGFDPKSIR